MMLSRRTFMTAGAGLALAAGSSALATGRAGATAIMTADGLTREDWFLDSSGFELANDRSNAAAAGKQLALIWDQRGCPYCRELHRVDFADKTIEAYVRSHFDVLELNLNGSRIVTDFDGQKLTERQLAARYGVRLTPTIQFFPNRDDLGSKAPLAREVHRIRGFVPPKPFLAMCSFVGEHAYENGTLHDYMRRHG
jgi:thioredoxin-related protein